MTSSALARKNASAARRDVAPASAPGRTSAPSQGADATVVGQGIPLRFHSADRALLERAQSQQGATLEAFALSLRAAELAAHPGFDRLICLPMVREMELLEHQVQTARTVLQKMRGRAMLCDEVGLGKTIEAGLVLDELVLRGLVRNVLVLTPPSLIEQWQGELRRKFALEAITHDHPDFKRHGAEAWARHDRIIASFHTAKRSPHREAIAARPWDMLIIDEAHHLRNRRTQLWQFASQLTKRYVLLLTATPVQNNLEELFNLATLLEPGLLSTAKKFNSRFVDRRDGLTPKNVDQLQERLGEVMVRNRRSTVGLSFTRRWARSEAVELTGPEQQLYHEVAELVRSSLAQTREGDEARRQTFRGTGLSRMAMITLQMELGSSAPAAAGTLHRLAAGDRLESSQQRRFEQLAGRAEAIDSHAKARRLLELLPQVDGKLVLFTHFRGTQQMLHELLTEAGYDVALFHGGLNRLEKERQVQRFRDEAGILLTTDAGSEGRNLQFCHTICNYDLPWNPQRIEQRIGRLSRIGQNHDVHVINLVAKHTIEAAILHLLEAKLAMFELVIGEIDMVLGNLDEQKEFTDLVADTWAGSTDLDDFAQRMERLGDRLVAAKRAYFEQREVEDRIFGDRFRPDA